MGLPCPMNAAGISPGGPPSAWHHSRWGRCSSRLVVDPGLAYPRGMSRVHELSRTDARRIAVRAQLLTRERPTDLVETVRQLFLVQLEPTSAVAPSAELVLWSRLGSA